MTRLLERQRAGRNRQIPDVDWRRAIADQWGGGASAAGPSRRDSGSGPFGTSTDVATVQVQYLDQSAPPLDASNSYNPGIFTINGQGAILNQDGTVNTPSNPARLSTIVSIYATGTGPLETPIPDGEITPLPPPYFLVAWLPEVTFAGFSGYVVWAGSAPGLIAGAMQINAQLPASLPAGTNLAAVPVMVISPDAFSPSAPISVIE
jgi:uncharacterized protein (TIGR03437 family)